MAAGDLKRPTRRQHAALGAAVERAEASTGMQFVVFLGAVDDERPRQHAEEMFQRAGLHERPAVLIVVAPKQRRVEVLTSETARRRISDADAASTVAQMTEAFRRGELSTGVIAALDRLAAIAGPGTAAANDDNLADVVDEADPPN